MAAKAPDLEKEVQALMELQEKIDMHAGLQQMVLRQVQAAKVQHRRAELTLQELSQLQDSVPVYKQVGKAYFMAPMQQLKDEIKDEITGLDDELKRLAQQQQHAAKSRAATEQEVQELFKANPELTRQLMMPAQ